MLGFKFIKTSPTEFVFLVKNGKIKKQGAGLSFYYFAPTSSISIVPIDTKDQPFIFNVTSKDFQVISIQGQCTYNIKEPHKIYNLLDFTVDSNGNFTGDGLEKLSLRIMNIIQVITREFMIQYDMVEALKSADKLVQYCKDIIQQDNAIISLGVDILDISILNISSTPDMMKALETSTREKILKEADMSIYERRNFAVEQERKIKENELETEIKIQQKNKQIEEEKLNAQISMEEKQKQLKEKQFETSALSQKKDFELKLEGVKNDLKLEEESIKLIELKNQNIVLRSEAKSKALELELKPLKDLPPEILEILLQSNFDTNQLISKAFLNLAKGENKIQNLNITPELLTYLLDNDFKQKSKRKK